MWKEIQQNTPDVKIARENNILFKNYFFLYVLNNTFLSESLK